MYHSTVALEAFYEPDSALTIRKKTWQNLRQKGKAMSEKSFVFPEFNRRLLVAIRPHGNGFWVMQEFA